MTIEHTERKLMICLWVARYPYQHASSQWRWRIQFMV